MDNIYHTLLAKSHIQLIQIDKQLGGVVHPDCLECQYLLSQLLADVLRDLQYKKIGITKYLN